MLSRSSARIFWIMTCLAVWAGIRPNLRISMDWPSLKALTLPELLSIWTMISLSVSPKCLRAAETIASSRSTKIDSLSMFLSRAMFSTILSNSWFIIQIHKCKKKWKLVQFPLQKRIRQTEVVTDPSSTSVASDSRLTLHAARKAKPHPQPRRQYDIEAETSIPQPPSVRKCSDR